jgi:hypothetical protein
MSGMLLVIGARQSQAWSYNFEEFTISTDDVMSISMNDNYVVWTNMQAPMHLHGYDLSAREDFTICTCDVDSMSITLSGDYVVWKESMNMDFYGYDLSAKEEFLICPNDVDSPSISNNGNFVVWWGMMDMGLYGYDLSAREKFLICPNDVEAPSINLSNNSDFVVWERMTANPGFYGYDLSTKEEFIICPNDIDSLSISISGEYVVWKDSMNMNLYGYNLSTKEEFLVCPNDVDSMSIFNNGNFVVWRDMMDMGLYGYDLSTREKFVIWPDDIGMGLSLSEYSDYVVWTSMMAPVHFYGYDLSTKEEFVISPNDVYTGSISISGDYVVWSKMMNTSLFGYDLSTKEEFIICPNDVDHMSIAISGEYVVWRDSMNMDLYGVRIYRILSDNCWDAVEIVDNIPYNGNTVGATGTDVSSCAYNDTIDVWHFYEPNIGGPVTISTYGSAFDTTLTVFNACGGTELACNDDYCYDNAQSRVEFSAVYGKTYFVRVAGFNGQTGDYQLLVTRGACTEPIKSDLNGDCKVNMSDLAILSSDWLDCKIEPKELCWE